MSISGRWITSLVVVGAVVGSVVSAAPAREGTLEAPQVQRLSEAPDVTSAAQAAHIQGSRVEVASERTATRTVYANPDGTETAEVTAAPIRVKVGNEWRPFDTTLSVRQDGRVAPTAADGGVSFSGGGANAALASLWDGGRTLSLFWPGDLPKPELSGNKATYREVLPGVDLVMLAERNGLQQHLVVKTRDAARNPALALIRMGMRAEGLRVSADDTGALRAVDDAGTEVFRAPPSVMWDSAGRTASIGVSIVDGGLMLAPDLAFLADPTAAYPVTIDPRLETIKGPWVTVMSGKPGTTYVNRSADPIEPWYAQVGQCHNGRGDCNGIGEVRTYFGFDTGFMHDKLVVVRPAFRTAVVYSPSCVGRDHVLHGVQQSLPDPMNWGNKTEGPAVHRFNAPTAYSGCSGAQGVEFSLGDYYSPSRASWYYLRTVAGQENDWLTWRRYDPSKTVWFVTYNRAPHSPEGLKTDPPLKACKWCGGTPYFSDRDIRLIATLKDPDDDRVRPKWRIQVEGEPNPIVRENPNVEVYKASGRPHSTSFTIADAHHGKSISWWVHADDGHAGSGASHGTYFKVDRKGIFVKPEVSSAQYPSGNSWHGAAGSPGVFTFSPGAACDPLKDENIGVCDIDRYIYSWTDGLSPVTSPSVDANALGGSASVTLAPPGDGPRTLYVQSVDRAGHASPTQHYRIYVRAGSGPKSQWSLESNPNDTAFLGDRHGILTGNYSFGPGAVGTGLRFDGADGSRMTAPNTVHTDASFSVSAWVWLDVRNGGAVAVEQRGKDDAGFALQYHGQLQKWIFVMPGSDANPQTAWYFVESPHVAAVGTWTHLAGTYDAGSRLMTMYVNGNPVGTTTRQTPWNAEGAVQLGRSFPGMIDEVQLYDRILGPAEVKAIVSRDNVQSGHWKFDEKEGATAGSSVDGGDALVLNDGAAFIDKGAIGRAAHFDGGNDYAVGSRPVTRTDQSFTVAAYVWADHLVPSGTSMTAVSQDGKNHSGFYLQYTGGRWVFLKQSTDNDNETPRPIYAAASQAPVAGDWIHLAGTYNAANGQMIIYVNGHRGGETTHSGPAWDATGPLTIGRAKFAGGPTDYWPGSVDEVRVYSRVLSPQEIEGIVSRDDVPVASWKLDGTGTDSGTSGKNGTLVDNQAWTPGQSTYPDPADLALNLDGDDHMKALPVLKDTTQSYSVSAWVRLGIQSDGWQTVATQSGTNAVAFTLGYSGKLGSGGPADRWAFQINSPDQINPHNTRVSSDVVAQVGVWTHVTAVFQSSSREMRLYVNGVQAGYERIPDSKPTFKAEGEFDVGRGMWNREWGAHFVGAIDDVKVYSRPLFADEARLMAGRELNLLHNWRLDEPSGTTARDEIGGQPATLTGGASRDTGRAGYAVRFNGVDGAASTTARDEIGGQPATLTGGASRDTGRAGYAVRFNGVDGAASTTGMGLATDKSFTVSAWVKLDDPGECPNVCQRTAVSVDGGRESPYSKFRLGHRIDQDQATGPGRWVFDMQNKDGSLDDAAIPLRDGEFGTWVFLVGVYDQPAGKLWLYVRSGDEKDSDDGTLKEPWHATDGKVWLGRDRRAGNAAGFWPGNVDDVRLYRGDLDVDRLDALHRSYPASAPSPTLPAADDGHWKFDENSGTEAKDSSDHARTATLVGGAGWRAGGRSGATGWLDGTGGFAETAGPVLKTKQSFSVTAWVYRTNASGNRVVLGQDGTHVSSFLLYYEPSTGKWAASAQTDDAANPNPLIVRSEAPAQLNRWTHLGVVYDAYLRQLRLYVNGMQPTIRRDTSVVDSLGRFSIGRGRWNNGNSSPFSGGIDDVRAFGKALSDGEVRTVHDDAPAVLYGHWGFEGTAADTSPRQNPTTLSDTGRSFGPGVRGEALALDGRTGWARARDIGVNMSDSFTVSAWAKLSSGTDGDATIVGQDAARMSGFLLQYNKNADRWIFGAAKQDADIGEYVYANSPLAPQLDVWTHLTGVYDYPAGQLRLYVNGELVDMENTALWPAEGGFTIGHGMHMGAKAGFFNGSLDEVRTHLGILSDSEIKQLVDMPAPAGGQLGRFVNFAGEHYTSASMTAPTEPFGSVQRGYRFEAPLGKLLADELPGTRRLYACKSGTDEFTSTDQACGGSPATKVADLGWAYTAPQTAVPTIAIYRCVSNRSERFDSSDPHCEGNGTQQQLLGYTIAYATLTRYTDRLTGEHVTTVYGVPPGYERDKTLGLLAMSETAGTRSLWSCRDGLDEFATTDGTCAGATMVTNLGRLWSDPPSGGPSKPIYVCQKTNGKRFTSAEPNCEDASAVPAVQLGYVATTVLDFAPPK